MFWNSLRGPQICVLMKNLWDDTVHTERSKIIFELRESFFMLGPKSWPSPLLHARHFLRLLSAAIQGGLNGL